MTRERDGDWGAGSGVDEPAPPTRVSPGKRILTAGVGAPSQSGPPASPGKRTRTMALPAQIARSPVPGAAQPAGVPGAVRAALATESGAPLPDAPRWSSLLGADLSPTRVVTGGAAEQAAQAIDARAFTLGDRVFFGAGQFAPETGPGAALMRHELTHVVQQKGAPIPDSDQLTISAPADAHEREAEQAGSSTAAPAVIARFAGDGLPTTAGGLRLDRELDASKTSVSEVRKLLVDRDWTTLNRKFEDASGSAPPMGERLSDAIDKPLWRAKDRVDSALSMDEPRKLRAVALLHDDVATLAAEPIRAKKLDYGDFARDVERVTKTYEQLADILAERRLRSVRTDEESNRGKERDFERRADLFTSFAKGKLSGDELDYFFAGLATDAEAFTRGEDDAPAMAGTTLVHRLLGGDRGFAHLEKLYQEVIDSIRGRTDTVEASTLLYLLAHEHLARFTKPAEEAITRLEDAGDQAAVDKLRTDIAREAGSYLARLNEENVVWLTEFHIAGWRSLFGRVGVAFVVPAPVSEALAAAEKAEAERKVDPPAPAPAPPAPTPAPRPAAPAHTCKRYGYDYAYVDKWLKAYWDDRRKFEKTRFDAQELMCTLAPETHTADIEKVKDNVQDFRDMARRALAFVDKQVVDARRRAKEIDRLKRSLGIKSEKPTMPPYVTFFSLANTFWNVLGHVIFDKPLDGGYEGHATLGVSRHFLLVKDHQEAVTAALGVLQSARKNGTERRLAGPAGGPSGGELEALRDRLADEPAWTADEIKLQGAEDLRVALERVGMLADTALADQTAERHADIESEVYLEVRRLAARLYDAEERKRRPDDLLDLDVIWPKIEPRLVLPKGKVEMKLAKEYAGMALLEVQHSRLSDLGDRAAVGMVTTDTRAVEDLHRRIDDLSQHLDEDGYGESLDQLAAFARGESTNLAFLFSAAETAFGKDGKDAVRAANLLRIAMTKGKAMTLTTATSWVIANESQLWMWLADEDEGKRDKELAELFMEFSDKDASAGKAQRQVMNRVGTAINLLQRSRSGGALSYLIAAERAGGGDSRKRHIKRLADELRKKGGTRQLGVAELIYLYVLEAPQLAESGVSDEQKEAFQDGRHPLQDRQLSQVEKEAWKAYGKVSGETTPWYEPGEKGWSELGDFGKEMLKVVAVGAVTGGIGGWVGGALGMGRIGKGVLAATAFTFGNRARVSWEGGENHMSLGGELIFNLVTMGIGSAAFSSAGKWMAGKAFSKGAAYAGAFAAEYAATSAINIGYMAYASDKALTFRDISKALLHNLAFLAAFKGYAVLGAKVTHEVRKRYGSPDSSLPPEILAQLDVLDAEIRTQAEVAKTATDSQQRLDALAEQRRLIREKEKVIRKGGDDVPYMLEMADDFKAAADLHHGEVARASMMVEVDALPIDNTPHFSYARSGYAEGRISKMLVDSQLPFEVQHGLRGNTFKVKMGNSVIELRPREAATATAATEKTTYTSEGRLEADRVETGKDVMKILGRNKGIVDSSVPAGDSPTFNVKTAAGDCQVVIDVVDAPTIKSPAHRSGPAVMEIAYTGGSGAGAPGKWRVHIEIRRNSSDDHIVRGINHEMVELRMIMEALAAGVKPGEGFGKYAGPKALDKAIAGERKAGKLKGKGDKTTAHDHGLLEELATMLKQLDEIVKLRGDSKTTIDEHILLDRRLDLLLSDFNRVWTALKLPRGKEQFKKHLAEIEDELGGTRISDAARSMLSTMHGRRGTGMTPRITELDLHIAFDQLKQANPKLMQGNTYLDLVRYYHEAIRFDAEAAVRKTYAETGDAAKAVRAGREVIQDKAGGTAIESWRGRAFEGLAIEELNADPKFVAEYGYLYQIKLNNFKTYDAIAIKGAEPPFNHEVNAAGRQEVYDANGEVLYAELPDGASYIKPGVKITLFSMKAKVTADMNEMTKAIGTPEAPTGQRMIVTKEYRKDLDRLIGNTADRVRSLKAKVAAGDSSKRARLAEQERRLELLEFFRDNLTVSQKWSNAKIDSMINYIKSHGIDVNDLAAELKKIEDEIKADP